MVTIHRAYQFLESRLVSRESHTNILLKIIPNRLVGKHICKRVGTAHR